MLMQILSIVIMPSRKKAPKAKASKPAAASTSADASRGEGLTVDLSPFEWWTSSKGRPMMFMGGDRVFSVKWGSIDRNARVVPAGVTAQFRSGDDFAWALHGPCTVMEVIDALCKTLREEPLDMIYPADATDYVHDCSSCPREGFCGFAPVHGPKGVVYEALWTVPFCHTGVKHSGMRLDAEDFLPENAETGCGLYRGPARAFSG